MLKIKGEIMKQRKVLCIFTIIAVLCILMTNKDEILKYSMSASIEVGTTKEMKSFEQEEWVVYYESGQEHIISDIVNLLPAIQEEQQKWFSNIEIKERLAIYIIGKHHPLHDRYFQNTKKGIYYIDLQLVVLNAETYAPENNFVHEYAHFLLHHYTEQHGGNVNDLPIWFIEGFANSFEWFVTNGVSESVWHYEATPFTQLEEMSANNRIEVYSQGFHAVLDLIEQHKPEVILQIIQKTTELNSFVTAFQQITNKDYKTYHENFVYDRQQARYFYELAKNNKSRFIQEAEAFIKARPAVHPYTAELSELLYKAYFVNGNITRSLYYARVSSSLSHNAHFLISIADTIGEAEPHLSALCLEKALFYSEHSTKDQELIFQKVQNIVEM